MFTLAAFLIIGILILAGLFYFVITYAANKGQNSVPVTELSSASRKKVILLKASIERLEKLTKQNLDDPSVKVLGNDALKTAYLVRTEAMKLAATRDQVLELSQRGNRPDADAIVKGIDEKLDAAVAVVDDLTLKLAEQSSQSEISYNDSELQALIGRLESIGTSFDEVKDTLNKELS